MPINMNPYGGYTLYTRETDAGRNAAQTRGSGSDLTMNDFMTLLVAQMTNQDMMNPVSNTEFIAQMAQFSSLQGINTLQEYFLSNYAVSYAGKHVVIATQNQATGALEEIRGHVEKVTFYEGSPMVYVNGKAYPLHQVMEISPAPIEKPVDPDEIGKGNETGEEDEMPEE